MSYVKISDAVHQELLNWARWCWQGEWPHPLPPTHCGSLESGYRAPPYWNPDDANEAPPPPVIEPNARNARIVQAVYDRLAERERRVLKAEYPCRRDYRGKQDAAGVLGISISQYDDSLAYAVRRVEEAFAVCA